MESAGRPRPIQRLFLLQSARVRLRADYLFWGYGVHNPKTFDALTAEFYDDCDDALVFDENGTVDAKAATSYRRYAWVAHTLNNSNPSSRLLSDLTRATGQPQVTADQSFLLACASFRTKIELLMRPHLLQRRTKEGLDDFMITMRRQGENSSSGIGYHRAFGTDALTGRRIASLRFSRDDRELADQFSRQFDDILHSVRLDTQALERVCREGKLSYWERVALPLLISERFDEEDIAIILRMKSSRVSRLRRDICNKLETGSERRRSLQCLFHPHLRDPKWDAGNGHLSKALDDLKRATNSWEPGFAETYQEPPFHERRRSGDNNDGGRHGSK